MIKNNWPAGLHLWTTPPSWTSTTTYSFQYLHLGFVGLWDPVSLVLWLRNMGTVYSSPYKVGLIYAGTKFAQS